MKPLPKAATREEDAKSPMTPKIAMTPAMPPHRAEEITNQRLLTIREVSYFTGLSVGGLYHLVSQKRIPVVRLSKRCIRFRHSDLLEWIQAHTQKDAR